MASSCSAALVEVLLVYLQARKGILSNRECQLGKGGSYLNLRASFPKRADGFSGWIT
jgi:hypothetical protein